MRDSSDFFLLWMMTRLRETGWPSRRGFLRRHTVVDEAAIIGACSEAVQIAIPLGAALPEAAAHIAASIAGVDENADRSAVDSWLDQAAVQGEEKVAALEGVYPVWQRFVSMTTGRDAERDVFVWSVPLDQSFLDWGSADAISALEQALALALIAMGWAVRHPDLAPDAFMPGEDDVEQTIDTFSMTRDEYRSSELFPYNFSLGLARTLVSRYFDDAG